MIDVAANALAQLVYLVEHYPWWVNTTIGMTMLMAFIAGVVGLAALAVGRSLLTAISMTLLVGLLWAVLVWATWPL